MANGRRPPGVFRVLSSAAVRDAVGFKPVGWPEASTSTGKRKRQDDDEATAAPDDGAPTKPLVMTRERLPPELAKYWAQRYRLFSLFDQGIRLDHEGWYSVTPEAIAQHIAERCRCELIVDAFCGVGGNAIQFAMTCTKVIAIDHSPERLAMAKHNARVYGVDNIEFVQADVPTWLAEYADAVARKAAPPVEVVFMSPAWGGPAYSSSGSYRLAELKPLPGTDLVALARKLTPDVALFLPRNVDLDDVKALGETPDSLVELEEAYFSIKLKAVTVYLGSLLRAP